MERDIDNEIVTYKSTLAETVNDYFANVASEMKEPMTKPDFTRLREGKSRQHSGKGAIRKKFLLRKPR